MMRSMFADQPYSPVTSTHGESARRGDTTTLSTLSSSTSFMSLQGPPSWLSPLRRPFSHHQFPRDQDPPWRR